MLDELRPFFEDLSRGQFRRALTENRVFRAWFRTGYPSTPRQQALIMFNNVFLHLHPVRIRRESLRITYTFCLGGLSFFLFLVLTVTGVLLMFYYRPATSVAYQDMKDLDTLINFGLLLPWDQLGIWAVTVGTNMAGATPFVGEQTRFLLIGGYEISDNTLVRWYVLHVIGMPLITAVLMAVYFWRIPKDGGIFGPLWFLAPSTTPPQRRAGAPRREQVAAVAKRDGAAPGAAQEAERLVYVWPHLVMIEFLAAVLLLLTLVLVSIILQAPQEGHANPDKTPNASKAPWYFLNLQELLLHMHHSLAGVLIPAGVVFLAIPLIPYFDRSTIDVGKWFGTPKARSIAIFTTVYSTIVLIA